MGAPRLLIGSHLFHQSEAAWAPGSPRRRSRVRVRVQLHVPTPAQAPVRCTWLRPCSRTRVRRRQAKRTISGTSSISSRPAPSRRSRCALTSARTHDARGGHRHHRPGLGLGLRFDFSFLTASTAACRSTGHRCTTCTERASVPVAVSSRLILPPALTPRHHSAPPL